MYRPINLEYGMKILFPSTPITIITPLGAFTDSSVPIEKVEMEVCRYWESDTDANTYKVKLVPISEKDKLRFGNERLYSIDLKSMICEGSCNIIE